MTTDPIGQPWGGGTYHGFSGARPAAAPAAAPLRTARPRRWQVPRAATIGGGIAAAVALGLALGYTSRPHLAQPTTPKPMQAVTPAAGGTLPVEVNAPVPPPPLKSAGKLEVLPPDLARSAPRAPPLPAAPPLPVASAPVYSAPAYPAPAPSRPVAREAYQPLAPQVAGDDSPCAGVRGRAAQMVCADPQLADADRELNRAYRRAMRSGASPDQLRAEQRDWLAIREDAARRSPRAVASVYEQRIEELNQIADDGPG